MPQIGDIRRAYEIHPDTLYGSNAGRLAKYIWAACADCGKERWVVTRLGAASCHLCANRKRLKGKLGKDNHNWKGGRQIDHSGYVLVYIYPNDFFFPMANNRHRIIEHRLVMAKHLGRCLQRWELVHHKNGVKDDNRIENLELTTNGSHALEHHKGYKDGYTRGLTDGRNKQIRQLKARIKELEDTHAN